MPEEEEEEEEKSSKRGRGINLYRSM